MNCEDVSRKLIDYVLGRTAGVDADEIRRHVDLCAACRKEHVETKWIADELSGPLAQTGDLHLSPLLLLDYTERPDSIDNTARIEIERHLESCHECLDVLGRVERLAAIEMPALPSGSVTTIDTGKSSFFAGRLTRFAAALSAAAVVALAVILFRIAGGPADITIAAIDHEFSSEAIVYNLPTRGDFAVAVESWEPVVLVSPSTNPGAGGVAKIRITNPRGENVWRGAVEAADSNREQFSLVLGRNALDPGEYQISHVYRNGEVEPGGRVVVLGRPLEDPETGAVAVAGFYDTTDSTDSLFGRGMPELLETGFRDISSCYFVGLDRIGFFRNKFTGQDSAGPPKDIALALADSVDASVLLSAQKVESGGRPFVNWQLLDPKSRQTLRSRQVPADDVTAAADSIIQLVLDELDPGCRSVPEEKTRSVAVMTTVKPDARDQYVLGQIAREQDRDDDAFRHMEAAVAIDSTFALAWMEIARSYYSAESRGQNRDEAQRAIDHAWRHRDRLGEKDRMALDAWRYQVEPDMVSAIGAFRKIVERWPDDREAIENHLTSLMFFWERGEVGNAAKRALEYYPGDEYFTLMYAVGLQETGHQNEALSVIDRFLAIHPDSKPAWYTRGWTLLVMGLYDDAERAHARARSILPVDEKDPITESEFAFRRGEINEAIRILDGILADSSISDGKRISVLVRRINCLVEAGRYREALDYCEHSRTYANGNHLFEIVEATRNWVLLRTGRAREALEGAESVIEAFGGDPRYNHIRSQALIDLDSLEVPRREAEWFVENGQMGDGPAIFRARLTLAEIAIKEHRGADALAHLDALEARGITRVATREIPFRSLLARAYQVEGRLRESERTLISLLEVYRGHALAYYELGLIYEEMGRTGNAIAAYTAFLEMWEDADQDIAEILDARERLKKLPRL